MLARTRWIRIAPLALGLALTMPLQACFGKMALTVKLWEFNGEVSQSYVVQELVFLGLVIVQAYTVVGFIDLFILNPIELFTGNNPISHVEGEPRSTTLADGSTLTLTPTTEGVVLVRQDGDETEQWTLVDTPDGLRLLDARGDLLAETVRLDDGTFQVIDGDGRVLAHPGRALLAEMGDAFLSGGARQMVASANDAWTTGECLAFAR